jgi:hypothetical protein
MAIDIQALVEKHIKPALIVDPTIGDDIPSLIEAQMAVKGFDASTIQENEKVYVTALTLESLVPRLSLTYTDEVQEHTLGGELVRLPSRAQFFKVLQQAITNLKTTAGKGIGVTSSEETLKEAQVAAWASTGVVSWG